MISHGVNEDVSAALGLDPGVLDEVGVRVHSRTLDPADLLISRGDQVNDVFVVLSGSVEVVGYEEQLLAVLGEGSVVGEVAALAGGVRTASVRAIDSTEVACIGREDFEALVSAAPELYERVSTEAIRRLDHRWLMEFVHWLLGDADPRLVDAIAGAVTWVRVKAGDYAYCEGDTADGGFAVIRGRIRVVRADTGSGSVSYEVGKGALIGEEGLVRETRRTDSALAVRDSVLVEVPRNAFLTLMQAYPKVVASVLANLMRQSGGDRRSERRSSFVIVSSNRSFRQSVRDRLVDALDTLGTTTWMSSEKADEMLAKPGVSQSEEDTPGDVRLSQLLYEIEQDSSFMLLEADDQKSSWSRRVVRGADTVLIAVPSDAKAETLEQIDGQLATDHPGLTILAVFHPSGTLRPTQTQSFVDRWDPDLTVHVASDRGLGMVGLARVLADRATGLVLGGGGARGFAHLGVWRALHEFGIDVDLIGGASMGAAMGALLARGGKIDEIEAEVQAAFSGLLDYTLPLVSLVKGKRAARALLQSLGSWNIEDLWTPYFCTSTNLTQSQVVVHNRGDAAHAVRASVAIPGVLPPVASGSDLLVDSGVLNNLPADIMRTRMPNGSLIAVDVAPSVGPGSHADLGMSVSATQVLRSWFKSSGERYPRLVPLLLRSMITASMRERDKSVHKGDIDLYLHLDMRGVGLLDFDNATQVAQAGYEAAAPQIEAWLQHREG